MERETVENLEEISRIALSSESVFEFRLKVQILGIGWDSVEKILANKRLAGRIFRTFLLSEQAAGKQEDTEAENWFLKNRWLTESDIDGVKDEIKRDFQDALLYNFNPGVPGTEPHNVLLKREKRKWDIFLDNRKIGLELLGK